MPRLIPAAVGRPRLPSIRFFLYLAVLAVAVAIVASTEPHFTLLRSQQSKLAELQGELKRAKAENSQLREEIERLNDPRYVELLARRKLGLVRPGERAYVVVPAPPSKEENRKKRAAQRRRRVLHNLGVGRP